MGPFLRKYRVGDGYSWSDLEKALSDASGYALKLSARVAGAGEREATEVAAIAGGPPKLDLELALAGDVLSVVYWRDRMHRYFVALIESALATSCGAEHLDIADRPARSVRACSLGPWRNVRRRFWLRLPV